MKILGDRLRIEREAKKMTQKQIADILNINRVTYTGWETGEHDPSLQDLIKIADFYRYPVDYFLGRYNIPQ